MLTLGNTLDGKQQPALAGRTLCSVDPATGDIHAIVPDSDPADLAEAVQSAQQAWLHWSALSIGQRAAHLLRFAALIDDNLDRLAQAECVDNGQPLTLVRSIDVPGAASAFRFFGHAITQFASEAHHTSSATINYTLRQPLGIVGCIAAGVLPLHVLSWKIAPALAAGNCVIAKPSEVAPHSAALLGELSARAGLPAGVLTILHGSGTGIGEAIVAHPEIRAISFTGRSSTGQQIAATAAPLLKKLSLELSAKNATLIFADCDLEQTLDTVTHSAFAHQGQFCLCGARILIQRSIYARVREGLIERVSQLHVWDPLDPESQQGALVSEPHMNRVLGSIERALADGGTLLCGGQRVQLEGRCAKGFFVAPTLIEGLPAEHEINQEEIFGPLATLIPFDNEAEAVEIANNTRYGLAFSLWSQDVNRCHRLAEKLAAGIIWVNCWMQPDPRTTCAGMKYSGLGQQGGIEALHFFTEPKNVCIHY